MSEATEKQTALLLKNGFDKESIDKLNKAAISEEIKKIYEKQGWTPKDKEKKQPQPSKEVIGVTQGVSEVNHKFQNAYEFGKAGDRLTIRFWDVEDFKIQVKELQAAKEELGLFEVEKH